MPLLEGNAGPLGLKKPETLSGVNGQQTVLYRGSYLALDPKDLGESAPAWSSLKASLLEGRTPASPFSAVDRPSALVYRQDEHPNSSRMCHMPVKPGFALYTRSPRMSGPQLSGPRAPAAMTVKKHKSGGENSTAGFENSVYLNIPKPVYGQSPCCHPLGCGLAPRYAGEHGLHRIPGAFYDQDWMPSEPRYAESTVVHGKDGVLPFEASAEQIKKICTDTCTASQARKLPAVDASYSPYPYLPTHAFFSPLRESSQQLHSPPHAAYEGMTSEMYQDSAPVSKYGALSPHPLVYYPPAHVDNEHRQLYKDTLPQRREHVPVVLKNPLLSSRDQSRAPHPLHNEIPVHRPEGLPRHPFNHTINYPHPYYAVPRYHLPQDPMRTLSRQHVPPPSYSSYLNMSPSGAPASALLSSAAHKHNPTPLYVSPSRAVPHADQTRAPHYAPHYAPRSAVSPPKIVLQRFVPTFSSVHLEKPDVSSGESRIPSPKTPQDPPGLSPSWLLLSPTPTTELKPTPLPKVGDAHGSNATLRKGPLKRSWSTASEKEEDLNGGMDLRTKRIKIEVEDDQERSGAASPPMPVIDSVFSLAPYRALMGLRPSPSPQRDEIRIKKERAEFPLRHQDAPPETPLRETHEPGAGDPGVKKEMEESEILRVEVVEELDPDPSDEEKRPDPPEPAAPEGDPTPHGAPLLRQEAVPSPVTLTTPKLPESKPNIEDVPPKPACYPPFSERSTLVCFPETMLPHMVEPPTIRKPVRRTLLELHRSVCKLVSTFVSSCPAAKLRDWLSQMRLTESPSSLTKAKLSDLLGFRARKEWLDPAVGAALEKVLERLREYAAQDRFPFPHVMRAGSVFLPMLVVKEIFFPMVQGSFIDQVLQENKVELRPSTLSEEKLLIQCDKRAASSKLRRLMSLKHLPKVYGDIFNLVYYTSVCQHMGATAAAQRRVQD